ncbi:MAG: DNA polymerase I 5'-3' exonuclease domain [uncultured Acidimicrobiales bacterium]|uniref:5'-3' exonuclease n=1 Tax=uncultured Acidimicrobiales bacterium TaxID=310071 RepID=A0A6J4HS34_9ACTN|nr:MAG: DNA polymerase I 5'-3' exonuclease domain [uncultured Acidimicrobiales bacterium]
MRVFLVDGTFELFRQFYGAQRHRSASSMGTAGVVGVLSSVLQLLEEGATHIGVATDHVIESFRNGLWPGYKTGAGIDPVLRSQFEPLELALEALGVTVWPMVDLEADDALASACAVCRDDPGCEQVVICTPDKDLAQCVVGAEVVQLDRIRKVILDEDAVLAKYGVLPASIPDWLALVGDSADGFPGLPGWGGKSAAAVIRRFGTLEAIPDDVTGWGGVGVRSAGALAATLASSRREALLFKRLATLVVDRSLLASATALRWPGPTSAFPGVAQALGAPALASRAESAAAGR